MNNEKFENYNQKRNELIKEFKAKKTKSILVVLAISLLAIVLDIILGILIDNVAISIVLGIVIVIFSVIMLRTRIVISNVSLQNKLRFFEQDYE